MKDNEMKIIGREQEIDRLKYIVESKKPEFVCVYGRRRVGKTFLIKQLFNERFSFYATGVPKLNNRRQLSFFKNCLIKYGYQKKGQLNSWLDAFTALIEVLERPDVYRLYNGKRIVGLIPARGGSKGIPYKNLIDLCGKPLISYTIESGKNSKYIDYLLVSTDDDRIAEISIMGG